MTEFMKTKKIKLIIVDFNGVLSYGNYHNLCNWLAKKYHKKEKDIYKILYHKWFNQAAEGKISERDFFENALRELNFPLTWREARKGYLLAILPNKPLINYLFNLRRSGYKVLVLSKNVPSQFNEGVEICKLKKYFKDIINTYDLHLPKASKETVHFILKKYGLKAKECIFIDDQDFNLVASKKLGMHTILYKNPAQMRRAVEKIIR